jgi:hypothetical protein
MDMAPIDNPKSSEPTRRRPGRKPDEPPLKPDTEQGHHSSR